MMAVAEKEAVAPAHELGVEADVDDGAEGGVDGAVELREMFVRRYSVCTRPWIAFHPDAYELTLNVALSADDAHVGGKLLGIADGRVQVFERREGEATLHSSKLLHGVSRMTSGTRYSLILFFDRRDRTCTGRRNRWSQPEVAYNM